MVKLSTEKELLFSSPTWRHTREALCRGGGLLGHDPQGRLVLSTRGIGLGKACVLDPRRGTGAEGCPPFP